MSDHQLPLFISAGDPSGDIAGSLLIKQLQKRIDDPELIGLGGLRMLAAGQRQLVDGEKLAVLGFWEVAKRFLFFKNLLNKVAQTIEKQKPKAIILIDYPGFNLRLARKIINLNIPIIYYISPQIWAWHANRIHQLKNLVDCMLLILPFETKIFDEAGISNKFVGHYLFDDIPSQFINAPYNIDSDRIILMPGSRPQEVQRMLPTMLQAAQELYKKNNKWKFFIAAVGGDIDYQTYVKTIDFPVEVIDGKTRELIADSRLVITSSGTATLETGIIGRPMVVIYKTGWVTYQIAKRLVRLNNIALINIIGGESIVPELIQNEASAENIVREAERFLVNTNLSSETVRRLNLATKTLGGSGTASRAADAIMELINC